MVWACRYPNPLAMAVKAVPGGPCGIVEGGGVDAYHTGAVVPAWCVGTVGVERGQRMEPAVASGADVRVTHR